MSSKTPRLHLINSWRTALAILIVMLILMGGILTFMAMMAKVIHPFVYFISSMMFVLAGVLAVVEVILRIWHAQLQKKMEHDLQQQRVQADLAKGARLSEGKLP